jgi:hypothetical protein
MRRKKWTVLASATAIAVVLGSGWASPALADGEPWQPGPITIQVPIDLSQATVGFDPEEVEDVTGFNARCFLPQTQFGQWTGSAAVVQVQLASTANVSCAVDVIVDYCYWDFIIHRCDGSFHTTVYGSGGPLYVDSIRPVAQGAFPSGTFPNAAGWYRSPGELHWYGYDLESGLDECTRQLIGGPDTSGRTVQGVCWDLAGLFSQPVSVMYKYDATAPALAPVVPSSIALGAVAHAQPGASDATSGVATSSCNGGAALDTSTSGTHSVTCTATDAAGNTATAEATYTVGYGFSGFDNPVSTDEVNSMKAGRAVPLKFRVTTDANGSPATLDPSKFKVTVTGVTCDLGDTPNLIEESATGNSGLQSHGDGVYQFNWASPKSYAGSCKLLTVNVGDGVAHTLEFAFTR